MSAPRASRLAWSLWVVNLAFGIGFIVMLSLARSVVAGGELSGEPPTLALVAVGGAVSSLGFATTGALIASRRPRNPIGWLFLAAALIWTVAGSASQYMVLGRVRFPGALPGEAWGAWLSAWLFPLFMASVALSFLLFPSGRVAAPAWRPLGWILVGAAVLIAISTMLDPALLEYSALGDFPAELGPVPNPTGMAGFEWAGELASAASFVGLLAAIASLSAPVVRFRSADGQQRQQIKWLAYAAVVSVLSWAALWPVGGQLILVPLMIIAVMVPSAAAIAIFKYRLYDIDRIINRTLVYGSLTLLLGGLYVAVVVGVGALVGDSGLLVAASTLLVAALFRSVRSKIQDLIDRRFYRRKYDASRALEEFSATLREEVDLDALSRELVAVVEETMQPANVSVWLRVQERGR